MNALFFSTDPSFDLVYFSLGFTKVKTQEMVVTGNYVPHILVRQRYQREFVIYINIIIPYYKKGAINQVVIQFETKYSRVYSIQNYSICLSRPKQFLNAIQNGGFSGLLKEICSPPTQNQFCRSRNDETWRTNTLTNENHLRNLLSPVNISIFPHKLAIFVKTEKKTKIGF